MPTDLFDVQRALVLVSRNSDQHKTSPLQFVPFGSSTRLKQLSNLHAARIVFCVTESDIVECGVPEWLRCRILTCPSAEHLWTLLGCLARFAHETSEAQQLIRLFSCDGRLAQWSELAEWPAAKGSVQNKASKCKHSEKMVGLLAKLFAKMPEKAAILKFGVSNRRKEFWALSDKKQTYRRLRALWNRILTCKFQQNEDCASILACTDPYTLVELGGARTSDFWGARIQRKEPYRNVLIGRNVMGKCLMAVREFLI
jgi:predicted NAD-dependent protein-ADP-ribosyltransferase YbiA (DUF1768 family)